MHRFLKLVVTVLLAGIVLMRFDPPIVAQGASEEAKAAVAARLAERIAARGQANVIVGLALPAAFVPEKLLSRPEVAQQRTAIAAAHAALRGALGGFRATEYASWRTLPYVAFKVDSPALQRLVSTPLAASIQEDKLTPAALASSTHLIGADLTAASNFRGDNWAVVIVDTGIDANHPFFTGRVVQQACFSASGGGTTLCPGGANTQFGVGAAEVTSDSGAPILACDNGSGEQLCDHGSHVAGIAAGESPAAGPTGFNGVAPAADIVAIQVFTRFEDPADCGGAPPCVSAFDSDQISALEWVNTTLVPSMNVASVNMSLGGGQSAVACDTEALKAPIDVLLASGVATVIAAGNDGWTDTINSPGCISTAVTVGGVTDSDRVIFNMGAPVDILAPGEGIDSSIPNDTFDNFDGTSMATPHVAGAFAVIRSIVGTSKSVAEILTLLQNSGPLITDTREAVNPGGPDSGTGTGHSRRRLQLDAAVAELLPSDVSVLKDCKPDNPLLAGQPALCTILVTNLGPAPALNVQVADQLASNGTFNIGTVTTDTGTCTQTANPQNLLGSVSCTLGNLAAGSTATIVVPLSVSEGQDITDVATVTSDSTDPNVLNNISFDVVNFLASANLELAKSFAPNAAIAGDTFTYTLNVKSSGPSTATNVVVEDFLPGQVSVVSATPSAGSCSGSAIPGDPAHPLTCNLGTLANGGTASIAVVVKVKSNTPNATVLINNASVHSDAQDPNNGNNSATASTTVFTRADLAIEKTSDKAIYKPSSNIIYTVTVKNLGPSDALAVVVTDNLPIQAIYVSNTGGCTLATPLTLTCPLGDLVAGDTRSFNVVMSVKGSRGEITNAVSVSSTGATPTVDPLVNNNTAFRTVTIGK